MKSIIFVSVLVVLAACSNPKTAEVISVADSAAILHRQHLIDSANLVIQKEHEKWLKTKAGKISIQHPAWNRGDCDRIANDEIWIGMHIDMVYVIYGRPDKINTSNYGSGNQYQYCWPDNDPSYFYTKQDGIVKSFN
jgi:hypothetical protein